MWLTCSSIGRKFVMALTGICLVLFVTFHVLMNSVALVWPAAYNQICMFLGANWYALVASIGLAALFIIHIIYALWLTVQNRAARGEDRYAVETRPAQVEWSSKNMLVLGIVVLAFLAVHLMQFWYKMQFQELVGCTATVGGVKAAPEFGTLFIQAAFSEIWTPVVYIIGFVALWFHMNHGFWSMFHSVGWDNSVWLPRLKCISCWWTSIVVLLFVAQAVVFTIQAKNDYYLKNTDLQEQYAHYWAEQASEQMASFQEGFQAEYKKLMDEPLMDQFRLQQGISAYIKGEGAKTYEALKSISEAVAKQCPDVTNDALTSADYLMQQLAQELGIEAPAINADEVPVEVAEAQDVEMIEVPDTIN